VTVLQLYNGARRWRMGLVVGAILVLAVFLPGSGIRAQGEVSVSARVDRSTITIGDLITYTVEVVHDKGVDVRLPGLGENLGSFEIRDYRVYDPQKQNGKIINRVDYVISTFEVGEFEIPPVAVRYSIPPDTAVRVIRTEAIKITVESLKPSEDGDIRDIKPPVELPFDWRPYLLYGGLALALAVLGFFLFWYLKKRSRGEPILPGKPEIARPPHELAYEELEALLAQNLLEKGEIKRFYSEISEIIRRYIEGRYQVPAMERTTTELLDDLRGIGVEVDHVELIAAFLERCDLVKFAKYQPSEEEHRDTVERARQIVDLTRWVETPAAEEQQEAEKAEVAEASEDPHDGEEKPDTRETGAS